MALHTSAPPRVRLVAELVVALPGAALVVCAARMDPRWLELHATTAFCFESVAHLAWVRFRRALIAVAGGR